MGSKKFDVKECAMHVGYWVNLRFKVRNLIDASADTHIVIHTNIQQYVYQLMGVFCERLKFYFTVVLYYQNKCRYSKKDLLFLLVSLCGAYKQIQTSSQFIMLKKNNSKTFITSFMLMIKSSAFFNCEAVLKVCLSPTLWALWEFWAYPGPPRAIASFK